MSSSYLQEFLAARNAAPFPLKELLILYFNARSADVYCDYFAGFKLLIAWLGPIAIPVRAELPEIPRCFHSYEVQEIAKLLGCDQRIIYATCQEIYSS